MAVSWGCYKERCRLYRSTILHNTGFCWFLQVYAGICRFTQFMQSMRRHLGLFRFMQILCKLLQASTYRPAQDGTGFVAVNLYRTMSRAVLPVRNTHQLPVSPSGQSRQIWPSTKPVYAKGGFENFHLTGLQICESSSGRTIEITDDT